MGSAPNLAYSGKPSSKLSCDRLISKTNTLGKTRTFTYDPAGNRASLTDRNGKTHRFSFDPLNRLTNETWIGNGRTINSTYDAADS
jgi:YD repeat-containing protein